MRPSRTSDSLAPGQCRYAETQRLWRECTERPDCDEEQVEEVPTGKAAICYAIVHALATLNQQGQLLLECLSGIHLASQYYNDREDYQPTINHAQAHYQRSLILAEQLCLPQLGAFLRRHMLHYVGHQHVGVA